MDIELIYCAAGNPRFAEIARKTGWLNGSQLPRKVYLPIHFADQDWRKPNRRGYMDALSIHRPKVATVLDLEDESKLTEVLDWAEEAAQFVEEVIVIPKVFGVIPRIPERINGADVRLGYSVPTRYGGTEVPIWEFERRRVHLLGGGPRAQMNLTHYLNVVSADGNMINKAALKGTVWDKKWIANYKDFRGKDFPYICAEFSCLNIKEAWEKL